MRNAKPICYFFGGQKSKENNQKLEKNYKNEMKIKSSNVIRRKDAVKKKTLKTLNSKHN